MFVRFRQARRLQVSLIETRRISGKVRHEHVASLGAVDVLPTVADRAAFWQGVYERLSKLSNRIDAAAEGKILGQVHARIPMVTIEELRALHRTLTLRRAVVRPRRRSDARRPRVSAALGVAVGLLLPSGAAGAVGARLGSRGWLWP
jgi:hypothetical protein